MQTSEQYDCVKKEDIEKVKLYEWKCINCQKPYTIMTAYKDHSPNIARCKKTKKPCIIRRNE